MNKPLTTEDLAREVTTRYVYPLTHAIEAAKAVIPHVSKDDTAEIIQHAKATAEHWIASDRYTIGMYDMTAHGEALPEQVEAFTEAETPGKERVLIPREALDWIAKINPRTLRLFKNLRGGLDGFYALAVTSKSALGAGHDPTVTVEILAYPEGRDAEEPQAPEVERAQAFDTMNLSANFPPVERLVNDFKPLTSVNNMAVVMSLKPEHLKKVLDFVQRMDKEAAIRFELSHTDNPNKPGPVRLKHERLTALVQPNLILG